MSSCPLSEEKSLENGGKNRTQRSDDNCKSVSWHEVDFHSHQVALPLACPMREAPEFFELSLGSRRQSPDTEPPSRARGINWMSLQKGAENKK